MTAARTTSRSALAAASALFSAPGPFASAYLDTTGEVPNTADRVELLWRGVRSDLAAAGAPAAVLDAMAQHVPGAHQRGNTLVLLADRDGVREAFSLPATPPVEAVSAYGAVPHLLPLVRYEQRQLPAVAVAVDRVGAEVAALLPDAPDVADSIAGDDLHVTRSKPGGWSQRRFQQRAENTWEANAALVAERLAKLVDQVHPRVVVVSGDVRAVQFLRDKAAARVTGLLHEVQGEYGDLDAVVAATAGVVARLAGADLATALSKLAEEAGQHDRAAVGVAGVVAAAQQGQVDTLLLLDDPQVTGRPVAVGPDPLQVAATPDEAAAMGVAEPAQAPLGDALVRAVLSSGGRVLLVPPAVPDDAVTGREEPLPELDRSALREGVGAVLRWAEQG